MAETERLQAAEEQLASARHAATEAAEVSADAWREAEQLRARVAELEQQLTTAMEAVHKCTACLGLIVWSGGRWQHLGGDEPCCPPGPEVRCVRTDDRRHWARTIGGDLWVHPPGGPIRWEALLALSAVTVCGCIPATPPQDPPGELAGGGQA